MSTQLDRIENKLDHLIMKLSLMDDSKPTTTPMPTQPQAQTKHHHDATHLLHGWTIKQHVCLQMLLRSASNEEIAERLGVTVNTAKVHVRTLMKKLQVSSRASIVAKCLVPFNEVDPDTYIRMTRGLPKDWDENYEEPDPFYEAIHGVTNDS